MSIFSTIHYLQHGTPRQQEAYKVLCSNGIMEKLSFFSPILAGTIPINIDIANSDLDVLCHYTNADTFIESVKTSFSNYSQFKIKQVIINDVDTVLANFYYDDFEIEIFAQPIPVIKQAGYKHMIIEHAILQQKGEDFRKQIIALKNEGYKTEPAFAKLLGLEGDPYKTLLNYVTT